MNEVEQLRKEFWTYVLANDEKVQHLDKKVSQLEREEYKLWKRISQLGECAGKCASKRRKSAGKKNKKERSKLEKALDAFVAREAKKESVAYRMSIRRIKEDV